MDPLATWRQIGDPDDPDERPFHALNLLRWLALSGYVPEGIPSLTTVVDRCETIIIRALEQ